MIKFVIIISIVFSNLNAFCQVNEEIITPLIPCYNLKNANKINPITLRGNYYGKMLIPASCDTVRLNLRDFRIKFAKLYSNIDEGDSIEIRLENKLGNFKFLENNMTEIIKNIGPIEIVKTDIKCDYIPEYNIPIKIESKKE